ncbi:S-layer homology domain-containing protein [Paenibacillus thalictri]|uniref:Cellulosome anchor protein n=1 Tax=Paenibacillus thalictri TaxID=2527873 RepID=A0A4Q9DRR0_9BACL|nr:S-layer homology domain-containing protein [Paenibacillus thalictri]TBL79469.1 hypothetical protein EYB31_11195 [Paenibacillus thalictri]
MMNQRTGRRTRRLGSSLLALLLLISLLVSGAPIAGANNAPDITLKIGAVSGKPGEQVNVPVTIDPGSHNIQYYNLSIAYDPAVLEPVAGGGAVTDESSFDSNDLFMPDTSTSGVVGVNFVAVNLITAKQNLFTMHFTIKADAVLGDSNVTFASSTVIDLVTQQTQNVDGKIAVTGSATLGIGEISGYPGDTVAVPVKLEEATRGVGSYGAQIAYDSTALEVTEITGANGDYFDSVFDNAAGKLKVIWINGGGETRPIEAPQKLFTIFLKIKANANPGDYLLTVDDPNDKAQLTMTDKKSVELQKTVTAGKVSVSAVPVPAAPSGLSATAGDRQVSLSWSTVQGATYYNVYSGTAAGNYDSTPLATALTGLSYQAVNLTNGTTYYFAVKAGNASGESPYSNEANATPQAELPGTPTLAPAVAGNGQVSLTWNAATNAAGYNIYQRTATGTYGTPAATVNGATYSETVSGVTYSKVVSGLSNGTTYYFVVRATQSGVEGASSNEVSAVPITVSGAPTAVQAVAGNGQAIVSFSVPSDDGGSAITSYEVTSVPEAIVAVGSASPIVVGGLTNGVSYTFMVKAVNGAGAGAVSAASNAVTPLVRGSGTSSGGSGSVSAPVPVAESGAEVLVNGKVEQAGTVVTDNLNGQAVTTIIVDSVKLEQLLAAEGQGAVITIPVQTQSAVVIGELNGQMIKNMEGQQAVVEIRTDTAAYTLPAKQINIDSVSGSLGRNVELQDIKVKIEIAKPKEEIVHIVQQAASNGNFTLVVPALEFSVRATYGDQTVEISKFNAFVERTIAIPDGVDPSKITTAIVVDSDGTVRHVPTKLVRIDGRYFAKINSLTNSTYSVIWHPVVFSDTEVHWAKEAVNDMGSRMIVNGFEDGTFMPDRNMTRAEFVASVIRGLGLKMESGQSRFSDVKTGDWYKDAVQTASAYALINGLEDGIFRPNDSITREQAMIIIARAMKISGLTDKLHRQDTNEKIRMFADADEIAAWAKTDVFETFLAGVVSGRSDKMLAPKANVTRAEVAVMIRNLLRISDLI